MKIKDIKKVYAVIKENPYISNRELRKNLVSLTDHEIHTARKILCLNGYMKREINEEGKRYFTILKDVRDIVDCSSCKNCYPHQSLWGEFWCSVKNRMVYDIYHIDRSYKEDCDEFKNK